MKVLNDIIDEAKNIATAAENEAKKLWAAIVELFETHPEVDTFHKTSDDQFFDKKENADGHASRLKNKGVAAITRADVAAKQVDLQATEQSGAGSTINIDDATQPTPDQIAAKALADQQAQDALTNQLGLGGAANTTTVAPGADAASTVTADAENAEPVKSALEIAIATPEAERTPVQKGLITKAANAAAQTQGENN